MTPVVLGVLLFFPHVSLWWGLIVPMSYCALFLLTVSVLLAVFFEVLEASREVSGVEDWRTVLHSFIDDLMDGVL